MRHLVESSENGAAPIERGTEMDERLVIFYKDFSQGIVACLKRLARGCRDERLCGTVGVIKIEGGMHERNGGVVTQDVELFLEF